MKPLRRAMLVLASVGLLAFGACARDRGRERPLAGSTRADPNEQDKSGVTTLTSAAWVDNETAIDRIAFARCARERTCASIGPDQHFTSGEACVEEVRREIDEDLHDTACPNGIESAALDECLDAIRAESCNSPMDVSRRVAQCRTPSLCMRSDVR